MIDRTGCPSTHHHGNAWAYQKSHCRCPDARAAQSAYRKRRALLNARGITGPDLTQRIPQWRVQRRMQALARLGWSSRQVGDRAWGYGASGDGGWRKAAWMSRARFDALDAVYRELAGQPGPSDTARHWAIKRDWPSPAAWDDIDDPNEEPKTRRREDQRRWRERKARKQQATQGGIAA